MTAPPCLICDLTRTLHDAYKEASWDRHALKRTAEVSPVLLRTPYAKAIEGRCADVAKDLFHVTKYSHAA